MSFFMECTWFAYHVGSSQNGFVGRTSHTFQPCCAQASVQLIENK
jgi:hypothetical protein